jgi:hypothetical protein
LTNFEYKVLTEVALYISENLKNPCGVRKMLKLYWIADRYFKRNEGMSLIDGTCYLAMENGPVVSELKNILEVNKAFLPENIFSYVDESLKLDQLVVRPKRKSNRNYLSAPMIITIDKVIAEFGTRTPDWLSDYSHNYPEWQNEKQALKVVSSKQIDKVNFFGYIESDKDFFFVPQEKLEINREFFTADF